MDLVHFRSPFIQNDRLPHRQHKPSRTISIDACRATPENTLLMAPESAAQSPVAFDDFLKLDVRVGTIIAVETFPQARKPAWKLTIDFGKTIGTRRSCAQITRHYTPEALLGMQIAAVINFPPRQIGPFLSEVLTLGFPDAEGEVVLVRPERPVPDGGRLF